MTHPDLFAIVIVVRAETSFNVQKHMGYAVRQLVFDIVRQHSTSLAATLEGDDYEAQPYTVAGLLRADSTMSVKDTVNSDERAWIRIVGLSAPIVDALEAFAARPPSTIEVDHVPWVVEAVQTNQTQHSWAGQSSYADLMHQYNTASSRSQFILKFALPTGFHNKSPNVPLPIPISVFGSLYERWNMFAPYPLPEVLSTFIENYVAVTRYRAETTPVIFKQTKRQIGFVGEAMYTILGRSTRVTGHDAALIDVLMEEHSHLSGIVKMLAAFAFYSGVGIMTTEGMGLARLSEPVLPT